MKLSFRTVVNDIRVPREYREKQKAERAERRKLRDILRTLYPPSFSIDTLVKRGMRVEDKLEIDRLVVKPAIGESRIEARERAYAIRLLALCDRLDLDAARKLVEIIRESEGISEDCMESMQKEMKMRHNVRRLFLMAGICLGMGMSRIFAPMHEFDRLTGAFALCVSAAFFFITYLIRRKNKKEQNPEEKDPKEQ